MVEYSLDLQNVNFTAIRTVRVLRPLRAINRVPSKLHLNLRLGCAVIILNSMFYNGKKVNREGLHMLINGLIILKTER